MLSAGPMVCYVFSYKLHHVSGIYSNSKRIGVKNREGQQCIFNVFSTKPVGGGVNKNFGVREAPPTPNLSPLPRQIEHCVATIFGSSTSKMFGP